VTDELEAQATALLLVVAQDPSEQARGDFDSFLYPFLLATAKRRGRWLAADAARVAGGSPLGVPHVPERDLNDVAHMVTVDALERARRTAGRFDPARGDGATWALGALALSYVDVVRREYGARRLLTEQPVSSDDLAELVDRRAAADAGNPAARYETVEAIDQALRRLTPDERFVLLARLQAGLSYREIAAYRFHDPGKTKQVDRLLQSARAKVRAAEDEYYGEDNA